MFRMLAAALLAIILAACGGGGGDDVVAARSCPDPLTANFGAACSVTINPDATASIDVQIDAELLVTNPLTTPVDRNHLALISFGGDGYAFTDYTGTLAPGQSATIPVQLRHTLPGTATANRPILVGLSMYSRSPDVVWSVRNISTRVTVR